MFLSNHSYIHPCTTHNIPTKTVQQFDFTLAIATFWRYPTRQFDPSSGVPQIIVEGIVQMSRQKTKILNLFCISTALFFLMNPEMAIATAATGSAIAKPTTKTKTVATIQPQDELILKRVRSVRLSEQNLNFAIPWFAVSENCNRRATMAEIGLRTPWGPSDFNRTLMIDKDSAAIIANAALTKKPTIDTVRVILTGPIHIRHGYDLYNSNFSKINKSVEPEEKKHYFWDSHEVVGIKTPQGIRIVDLSTSPTKLLSINDWIRNLVPANVSCNEVDINTFNLIHTYWSGRTQFPGLPYPSNSEECGFVVKQPFGLESETTHSKALSVAALIKDINDSLELLKTNHNGALENPDIRKLIGNNAELLDKVFPSKIDFLKDEKALCQEWSNAFQFCHKY
jgi:hypothetical protein